MKMQQLPRCVHTTHVAGVCVKEGKLREREKTKLFQVFLLSFDKGNMYFDKGNKIVQQKKRKSDHFLHLPSSRVSCTV